MARKRHVRRYLEAQVRKDLARKMVFVAGPRQVGKTTLARLIARSGRGYLSWDVPRAFASRRLSSCSAA